MQLKRNRFHYSEYCLATVIAASKKIEILLRIEISKEGENLQNLSIYLSLVLVRTRPRSPMLLRSIGCTSRTRGSRDEETVRTCGLVYIIYIHIRTIYIYRIIHIHATRACTFIDAAYIYTYIYIVSSSSQKWSEVEATHSFPQQVFPTPPRITPTSFCGSNSTVRGGAATSGERQEGRGGEERTVS